MLVMRSNIAADSERKYKPKPDQRPCSHKRNQEKTRPKPRQGLKNKTKRTKERQSDKINKGEVG
jgi:hypothetical protein